MTAPNDANLALRISATPTWLTSPAATIAPGMTSEAIASFESTVSVSLTGSDLKNRMLRSRRSPYSASAA